MSRPKRAHGTNNATTRASRRRFRGTVCTGLSGSSVPSSTYWRCRLNMREKRRLMAEVVEVVEEGKLVAAV